MFRRVATNPAVAVSGLLAAALGLAAFAAPRAACGELYVVARHDTLSRIAQRCRSSVAAIAAASGVRNPDFIRIGQHLLIPGRAASAGSAAPPSQVRGEARGYRFDRGDTLFSLARWSRVGLPALLAANPGIDPQAIELGELIRLPRGAAAPQFARARERGQGAAPVHRPDRRPEPIDEPDTPGI